MRVATWNVNSLRARLPAVEGWIARHEPDVLLMQETKCTDAEFPSMTFAGLGYETVHHGDGRWNGVAIASRVGLEDVTAGFHAAPSGPLDECRIVSATCNGVRVISVYVPNGRVVESEHYVAKLAWLEHLRQELDATCLKDGDVIVAGDFNVAPGDEDVWDPAQFVGATHVSVPERAALANVLEWGLVDALRLVQPQGPGPFSWWDYRAGAFHKGWGMRIDLMLISRAMAGAVQNVVIDREARKVQDGAKPSDHAPVILDLER